MSSNPKKAQMARWVASTAGHGRPTRQTLAALIAYWPARGRPAHRSQAEMAKKLGVCVRTVYRWTKELEAAGQLKVDRFDPHHDPHDGRWKRRVNGYRPRFAQTKRPPNRGKGQVSRSGHPCPVNAPSRAVITPAAQVEMSTEAIRPPPYGRDPSSRASFLASCRDAHPDLALLPPPIRPNVPAIPC